MKREPLYVCDGSGDSCEGERRGVHTAEHLRCCVVLGEDLVMCVSCYDDWDVDNSLSVYEKEGNFPPLWENLEEFNPLAELKKIWTDEYIAKQKDVLVKEQAAVLRKHARRVRKSKVMLEESDD